jgi:hypothetical protein
MKEMKEEKKKETPAATEATYKELVNALIEKGHTLLQKPMTISEYKDLVEAINALQPLTLTKL